MYHNIMWNWSWNHWTSPPVLGHWSRTMTAWWTGHWLQPAASCRQGSCWGEPEFKFSSGQSCAAAGLACTLYTCTVAGRDCTTVRGPGLGPGGVISLDTAIVTSTQSQPVSLHRVITEWERESCPGPCTPTCTSPSVRRANVRAPSACTGSQTGYWKWKSEENLSLQWRKTRWNSG